MLWDAAVLGVWIGSGQAWRLPGYRYGRCLMEMFELPRKPDLGFETLFCSRSVRFVQSPEEAHDYKKVSGSSDGAKTYDTTAV
ncbi:hypothetical protein GCM10010413_15100 [Promicromonospora sukumoe]